MRVRAQYMHAAIVGEVEEAHPGMHSRVRAVRVRNACGDRYWGMYVNQARRNPRSVCTSEIICEDTVYRMACDGRGEDKIHQEP
jgi:hypothetical protein